MVHIEARSIIAVIALFLALSGLAIAGASVALYGKPMQTYCVDAEMKNHYIWLPSLVSMEFEGKRVVLHFYEGNKSDDFTVTGIVGNGGIYELSCGKTGVFDYEVWMDSETALEVGTSDAPVHTFIKDWRTGKIRLDSTGRQNLRLLEHADEVADSGEQPVPKPIRDCVRAIYSAMTGRIPSD